MMLKAFVTCACILVSAHSVVCLSSSLESYLDQSKAAYHEDLVQFVSIPSVSAIPEHQPDIDAAALWLAQRLQKTGMQHVAVLDTGGPHPIVYAHWFHHLAGKQMSGEAVTGTLGDAGTGADASGSAAAASEAHAAAPDDVPTLMIYGHYDVQPVDPVDMWESPPFNVTEKDGYLYGRGVDDDKGGVLQAIQAVEAILYTSPHIPKMNIKFLLEGQEEVMSPDLSGFLRQWGSGPLLRADAVLSADGGQPSEKQGGISLGLRGVVGMEVEVVTAGTDMHSGFKGGSVANPCIVMSTLLATLHDKTTGRIDVDEFYEGVPDMTDADKADIAAYPFDESKEAEALGVYGFVGEQGFNTLERRWFRPTLEVVGTSCGYTGAGIKTVIPRVAHAKISCRLVGHQNPSHIVNKVRQHLESVLPSYARLNVTKLGGSSTPWSSPRDLFTNQLAARVSQQVHGVKPLFLRDGATIPALSSLSQQLGLPCTKWGWGLGMGVHAPNERIPIAQWHKGRTAWVMLLNELEKAGAAVVEQGNQQRAAFAARKHVDVDEGAGAAPHDEL